MQYKIDPWKRFLNNPKRSMIGCKSQGFRRSQENYFLLTLYCGKNAWHLILPPSYSSFHIFGASSKNTRYVKNNFLRQKDDGKKKIYNNNVEKIMILKRNNSVNVIAVFTFHKNVHSNPHLYYDKQKICYRNNVKICLKILL